MLPILIESIVKQEGFRSKPYPDPIHGWEVPTYGHGLTYITESESLEIVKNRLIEVEARLRTNIVFFYSLHYQIRNVLIEMAYQMGVNGVLKFKNMLRALSQEDYETAADEMLDSRWAKQTPSRAKALSEIIRGFEE